MQQGTYKTQEAGLEGRLPPHPEPPFDGKHQLEMFTDALFERTHLIEFRIIRSWEDAGKKRSQLVEQFWLQVSDIPAALPRLQEWNTLGANIYFGVNPRTERSGRKESVSVIRSIWMDMDDVEHDEARTRWEPYLPADPTIVVDSGHGIHAYWVFCRPFTIQTDTDRESFEGMLKAIYQAVGADAVQDVSRVLRLPGLLNVKSLENGIPPVPCTLLKCDPGRTFPISTFDRWWYQAQEELAREKTDIDRLGARSDYPQNRDLEPLLTELDRDVSDRSRRDYAIIIRLLQSGLGSEEIWPLVRDKSKFEDRGREYFDVTIQNAMQELSRGR